MLGIPNPVAYPCANCGEPAVLAEYPTGLLPVHCGTFRAACRPPRRSSRRNRTVSGPPRAVLRTGARTARHKRPRTEASLRAAAVELARRVSHLADRRR
ncbi:MAG TPA: hypothetical protein VH008_05340 [Pseudonocardia sp.]|jgi:hypothetical protein|nr:hypothetical protein [Pseudonocardia sp.]